MMKLAKASQADLEAAMELCGSFEGLTGWSAAVPEKIAVLSDGDVSETFDRESREQCVRVLGYLLDVADRASLARVVYGCAVVLDPRNKCVDPDADTIEHHPDLEAASAARRPRSLDDWHPDDGDVLWWRFPTDEPPYCGQPGDTTWPGHHTHWTPLLVPVAPIEAVVA